MKTSRLFSGAAVSCSREQSTTIDLMSEPAGDSTVAGSIPKVYEMHPVPLIFQPYARDLVSRLNAESLSRVLEIAAGTGLVTLCAGGHIA